ncbi:hypothetical protein LF1_47510 [Rubripirellula obstinata]|uniref:Uncharacterized protein n=1 Tax=Rubripirellula obstinata TaxID=406547 RepID=A0A5B1CQR2_9BACT|nr:hypothetical protein [Rubripirellula obstinata]KAA1262189.1 hypothetical protein LF1_47510 [Rubripirellula obstinata]
MQRSIQNRRATTYLEVQVAMVMLAIATAGLYSVSVIQTKQSARLSGRVFAEFADADAAINAPTNEWARKLGAIATVDEVASPANAIDPDNYFVSITDNLWGGATIPFRAPSDFYTWYHWHYFACYGGTAFYHPEFSTVGAGSYCEQRITGIPSGNYEVLITYPYLSSLGTGIPYEIYDGATLVDTVIVNQTLPCDDTQLDGHDWERIAVMPINSGTLRIRMLDGPNGDRFIIADAIAVRTRKFELTSVNPTAGGGATAVVVTP